MFKKCSFAHILYIRYIYINKILHEYLKIFQKIKFLTIKLRKFYERIRVKTLFNFKQDISDDRFNYEFNYQDNYCQ